MAKSNSNSDDEPLESLAQLKDKAEVRGNNPTNSPGNTPRNNLGNNQLGMLIVGVRGI